MRVVVALGGNALLKRGQPLEADVQRENVKTASLAIAEIAKDHQVVVTHGNGPQVGLLALQAEAYKPVSPYPLDVLDAQTEGMIGYLLEQELRNYLKDREIVTLLTQIEVDPQDKAFTHPTKPIGPLYSAPEAQHLAQEKGWAIAADGNAYRRVVPSPEPKQILELPTIRLLVETETMVICAGGGGIPVVVTSEGIIQGVEAVIDKDLAGALLAIALKADALLLLTDVEAVYKNWGSPDAEPLRKITPQDIRKYTFAPGSMSPKVEAACRFVERTGGYAGIGKLEDGALILKSERGTIIQ